MALAVGKVFLYDTAHLTDLYRVLSFLGLGLSLLLPGGPRLRGAVLRAHRAVGASRRRSNAVTSRGSRRGVALLSPADRARSDASAAKRIDGARQRAGCM